jgi:DnaJ family protein C protein 27
MTIGVDFGVKPIRLASGKQARVNFWDLSGRPEFLEVRNEFYRDSQAGLLVFDICKPESFDSLEDWLREAQRFGAPSAMPVAVCGNKTDKAGRRRVSAESARAWAAERGLSYFEASAQTGEGVSQVFETLLGAAGTAWVS